MNTDQIHPTTALLLINNASTVLSMTALRAVIPGKRDANDKQEITFSIQCILGIGNPQYLLTARRYPCPGECLAEFELETTKESLDRAWLFNSYNEASYILGWEWLLATRCVGDHMDSTNLNGVTL